VLKKDILWRKSGNFDVFAGKQRYSYRLTPTMFSLTLGVISLVMVVLMLYGPLILDNLQARPPRSDTVSLTVPRKCCQKNYLQSPFQPPSPIDAVMPR
jgi:hypothetical protein